jgi:hypothetical protein
MPRFEVLAGEILVGYSELESGDAPMGVATGVLLPTAGYSFVQADLVATRESSQAHLNLAVRLFGGEELPSAGGVHITDYSVELGIEDGIEVAVLGIGYPLYEELFPEHVAAYRAKFAKAT